MNGTLARRPPETGRGKAARLTRERAKERKGYTPARRPARAPAAAGSVRPRRTRSTAKGTQRWRTAKERTTRTPASLAATKWEGARAPRDSCGEAQATRVPCQGSEATEAPACTWCTTTAWKNWRRMLGNAGTPTRAARGVTRAGTLGRGIAPPPATRAARRSETEETARPARSATKETRRRSGAGQAVRAPLGHGEARGAGAARQTAVRRHPTALFWTGGANGLAGNRRRGSEATGAPRRLVPALLHPTHFAAGSAAAAAGAPRTARKGSHGPGVRLASGVATTASPGPAPRPAPRGAQRATVPALCPIPAGEGSMGQAVARGAARSATAGHAGRSGHRRTRRRRQQRTAAG
jgi:hypothetical protein